MKFDVYDPQNGPFYDETFAATGVPRPGFEPLVNGINALEPGSLLMRQAAADAAIAEGCTVDFEHIFRIPPMAFDPRLLAAARTSVREVEGHDVELPSGALHDASEMAREVPTVMIFSSSIAGLSHTKEEDTPDEHLHMAVDAFNRTVRRAIDLVVAGEL